MQVGDLIKVGPSFTNTYIVTSLEGRDVNTNRKISNTVTVVCLDDKSPPLPVKKKRVKVINASR